MIDHMGFPVADFSRSKAFFDRALAPLGIEIVMQVSAQETGGSAHAGYGNNGKPFFWIGDGSAPAGAIHIAFEALSRSQVDAFYAAALAAGAKDNGPPGLRADYHPNYYAAFVLDPDGNNIEAVCHHAE
ncbi:VOC family protein [Methylocella silvestris]|uniref:Glyoxalase/bleomycin resistance/extradiol dioxygenase family protein n=1 Tax=Methylocella silvestris TaxID=199596 RepID=A0A2J7TGX4_METSI|nr:VOC family protein [Methylocella silvestris]PNG26018.1 glyoxalase/bleomycin resistance/extradiol dioxygenase family protein [Methylocella silvestris]